MSIVVASAFNPSWCEFVQDRLIEMGVPRPVSAERSQMDVSELLAKMCASVQANNADGAQNLGRAWEIVTADLFVANAEASVWGWVDDRNVHVLDFMLDFDPRCKFLLVYSTLSEALAEGFTSNGGIHEDVAVIAAQWRDFHETMLRFYQAYPDRCVLINISAFQGTANRVTGSLSNKLAIPVRKLNESKQIHLPWLEKLVAMHFAEDFEDENELLAELNGSADVPRSIGSGLTSEEMRLAAEELGSLRRDALAFHNLSETSEQLRESILSLKEENSLLATLNQSIQLQISKLDSELNKLRQEKSSYLQRLEELEGDNFRLLSKLNLLKEESERAEKESDLLARELSDANEKLNEAINVDSSSLREENSLMALQLAQIQSELERYFNRYQKLKQNIEQHSSDDAPRQRHELGAVPSRDLDYDSVIDFRSFIDGENWHAAEPQGRWAGKNERSSIRIGGLEPAKYQIRIRVADAITLEHFNQLQIEANGKRLSVRNKLFVDMAGRLAPLRRIRARLANTKKPFPAEVLAIVPEAELSKAGGNLELCFRTPTPESPAKYGEPDDRTLSICIESLTLSKRNHA